MVLLSCRWWFLHIGIFFIIVTVVWTYFEQDRIKEWFFPKPPPPPRELSIAETKPCGRGFCDSDEAWVLPQEYPKFITPIEGQYILQKARPLFSESTIVSGTDYSIRKSETAWLRKTDPVIASIAKRVCSMVDLPFENAEDMQVVRYDVDGYYNEHHDSCCDDHPNCVEFESRGGQRMVTMIIYLNDDFEGGGTIFPHLKREYRPETNKGLLFYPMQRDGEHGKKKAHPKALHAGLPVTRGQKCIANIWIRESRFV